MINIQLKQIRESAKVHMVLLRPPESRPLFAFSLESPTGTLQVYNNYGLFFEGTLDRFQVIYPGSQMFELHKPPGNMAAAASRVTRRLAI